MPTTPSNRVTPEKALAFGQEQLATPTPANGIVILYDHNCGHCQHSLENTAMATQTSNGTPVKWIDIRAPEITTPEGVVIPSGMAQFLALPGVTVENGNYMVGGKSISAVPTTLAMNNGTATEVLKVGVLERGDLDMMAAMQQSKAASQSQGTGTTVPYATPPQAVGSSR